MYSENLLSKKLKSFADGNEWLISGEYIYGEEQGYLFTGMDGKGLKTFITPVPGITDDQKNLLFEMLEKNKNTMQMLEYAISDGFLCIRIKDSMRLKTDDIEFVLALLVGNLQELNIGAVCRCQECLKPDVVTTNFMFDLYCYMHEECAQKVQEESDAADSDAAGSGVSDFDEDSMDKESGKHFAEGSLSEDRDAAEADATGSLSDVKTLKKVLFTIFGALIGSIPWLLLPFILDVVNDFIAKLSTDSLVTNFTQLLLTCVCAYLVSYFAIVGYRLSKAGMNTKGRWIVGIVSISVVFVVQFLYLAVLIAKEPIVDLTFKNYMVNIVKYVFYINMILGFAIGTIFTLIAVLPFFDGSKSAAKAKKAFLEKKNKATPMNEEMSDGNDDAANTEDNMKSQDASKTENITKTDNAIADADNNSEQSV